MSRSINILNFDDVLDLFAWLRLVSNHIHLYFVPFQEFTKSIILSNHKTFLCMRRFIFDINTCSNDIYNNKKDN